MSYIIYPDKATADKQQAHVDELAKKDGWREETKDDLTIGAKCRFFLDETGDIKPEWRERVLRLHHAYPFADKTGVKRAVKVDALMTKYTGDVDPVTGDKIDLKAAVEKLPVDWTDALAVAVEKVVPR